jgi:flagellar motor switch/type III secretory pathway protein FliN
MVMETLESPQGQLGGEAGTGPANPGLGREAEEDERWRPVLGLPCELMVDLPLPDFRIADLLKLGAGSVINAHWRVGQDVPLRLNGTLIGWIEFEVVGNNLAVRLTELA